MSNKLSRLKTQRDDELSNRFRLWLNKERGRQVKGIEYFLKKRSDNTDLLITEIAKEHGLVKPMARSFNFVGSCYRSVHLFVGSCYF